MSDVITVLALYIVGSIIAYHTDTTGRLNRPTPTLTPSCKLDMGSCGSTTHQD